MAVVAMAKYGQAHHHKSSKKGTKEKLIRVLLLDSGSDGDLLFHQKGKPKHFPYLTRQVPYSWHMSNGVFPTTGRGKLTIKFFEYSNSKEFLAEPDVFEYDKKMGKPAFDLIIGCDGKKRHRSGKKESSNSFAQVMERFSKLQRKSPIRESAATKAAILVIPTQNRIMGTVVLENPVTIKDLS